MTTLIVGAGSAIAKAVTARLLRQGADSLVLISRSHLGIIETTAAQSWVCDYAEASILACCRRLRDENRLPRRIYICNGRLHDAHLKPEKRMAEFEGDNWLEVMQVNALLPMLWVKKLVSVMPSIHTATLVVFSARVGSISDNRSGGWYSYRSSKAALMLFHPGTTDTPLSKPIQKIVPGELPFVDWAGERIDF